MATQMKREYESIIVLRPDATDEITQAVRDRIEGVITEYGGDLLKWDNWGKRKLAYTIRDRSAQKKHTKANYHYIQYLGGSDLVPELSRNFRLMEPVLKFITVKVAEDVDVEVRKAQPPTPSVPSSARRMFNDDDMN